MESKPRVALWRKVLFWIIILFFGVNTLSSLLVNSLGTRLYYDTAGTLGELAGAFLCMWLIIWLSSKILFKWTIRKRTISKKKPEKVWEGQINSLYVNTFGLEKDY